jgi:cyclic-di-GMP-binding protein
MPSFDVVSELDMHEVTNAINQANKEVETRFDFKGADARFELEDKGIAMEAEVDFQLDQMLDILRNKLIKRSVDISCMEIGDVVVSGKRVNQKIELKQGIDSVLAKKMVKFIKDGKVKVQAAIQGEKLRVSGKKRDDLQQVIAALKNESWGIPLQFENFRD